MADLKKARLAFMELVEDLDPNVECVIPPKVVQGNYNIELSSNTAGPWQTLINVPNANGGVDDMTFTGGIGRYVRELVAALALQDPETAYRLFVAGASAAQRRSFVFA